MLTIRKSQFDELSRQAAESFNSRVASELQGALPEQDLSQKLPQAIAFARSVGLSSEQDIARFAAVACSLPVSELPREALSNLKAYGKDPAQKVAAFENWARQNGVPVTEIPSGAFSSAQPGDAVQACPFKQKTTEDWIEIELIGEDGFPIPWVAYQVVLPTGEITDGYLDDKGYARFDHLPQSGNCQIKFPELDEDALTFIESTGPRPMPAAAVV